MKNVNKLTPALLLITVIVLSGCSPAKMNSTWIKPDYTQREYAKIAVVGISPNLEARSDFEEKTISLLQENGINAISGIRIFPPGIGKENYTAQDYIKIIKDNKLDGVLTMALVDTNEITQYQPGEYYNIPSYYRVGRYIVRRNNTLVTPGYYEEQKQYLIEAVLYNVSGDLVEGKETMVWTGQSSLVNPTSTSSAANSFTKIMVNQLIKDQIIKTNQQ